MKILIIEDEAGTRALIAGVLKREGFIVQQASNGREGLEKAIEWRPDLVLSDIDMPELDGFGVLNGLRAHPELADVPIVFLTVFEDRDVFRHSMKLGVDDFLNKPVKPDELIEAVSTRLAKQKTAEIARQRRSGKATPEEDELAAMYQRYLSGVEGTRYDGITTQQILAANQKSMVVTVLMASVRNYAAFAEKLDNEQCSVLLSAWFALTCPKVQQWGGTVNRFVGEGFLALFGGTGLDVHTHARYALHAAADIQAGERDFVRWCESNHPDIALPPVRATVALVTGEVTFFEQRDRTQGIKVTGDAVSLASKLEIRARELGWPIITSAATLSGAGLGVMTGAREAVRIAPDPDLFNVIEVVGMPPGEAPNATARLDQSVMSALAANSSRAAPALRAALEAHGARISQEAKGLPSFPGYRLMDKIGQGGMSEVWRAERIADGQVMVLKLLDINSTSDSSMLQRFIQEYTLVSSLKHRNVVKIFDQGIADNNAYIAMEYFGGGDLVGQIAHGLPIVRAITLAGMTGEALAAIHARGVVHRDIKPANLMLRDDGSLALCDFGIARELVGAPELTKHGEIIGTPHYISPEQIKGLPATAQSDLYSFGVMFYEMLVGKRPFAGTSIDELLAQHMIAPIPQLPPAASAFQPILERLLAKNPADRYPGARQFVDELLAVDHKIG